MATVQDQRDSHRRKPVGALALPASRFSGPMRPLYCALTHMSQYVGGDAQHALIWLAVHAAWPSGLVEVGIRRLVAVSGMPDHAMRAALTVLDEDGWAPVEGRGAHGVYRRRLQLCHGCQRGNSSHAGAWFSVAGSYMLEPARRDGQRGNRCHETEREVQGEPSGTPVSSKSRPGRSLTRRPPTRGRPAVPGPLAGRQQAADALSTPHQDGSTASHPVRSRPAVTVAAPGGAARTTSRDPPGVSTGDAVLSPSRGHPMTTRRPRPPWV